MKKALLLAMLGISCLAFSACGNGTSSVENTSDIEAVADEVGETEGKAIKATYENEFKDNYPDDYEESLQKQVLVVYEDNSAKLYDMTKYSEAKLNTMETYGSVEEISDGFRFTQNKIGDSEPDIYTIKVSGNELIEVEYYSPGADLTSIVGEYKGASDVYGDVTLKVEPDKVILTTEDGSSFTGSIYESSYGWDFYYNNVEEGDPYISIDWIVQFGDGTFTYKEYTEAVNEKYAGEYKINGDLGEIIVTVDTYGNASADVQIDGVAYHMTGGIRTDYENDKVAGFYLTNEDENINLNLEFQEIFDGEFNYYGTIVKNLNAG